MFYIKDNEKIVLFDENIEVLKDTVSFIKQYQDLPILESDVDIVDFNGEYVFSNNEEYLAYKAQQERERIAKLYLTGADVERGIYQAKGMDFEDIMAFVMANPPVGLDIKALKIELKANHFYRGNPYVNAVGALLGFTSEMLDKFFEYNDYSYLIPPIEEITEEENVQMD